MEAIDGSHRAETFFASNSKTIIIFIEVVLLCQCLNVLASLPQLRSHGGYCLNSILFYFKKTHKILNRYLFC